MLVLVTGSAGNIGRVQVQMLREAGHEIRTFDQVARRKEEDWEHIPGDLRDLQAVRRAVQGVDAVAHLGAIASDRRGSGEDVLAVNVQGTWNVLIACVEAGVGRVVYFSSVNALGCVGGYQPAVYLPIDDAYPRHPFSPYQLSKNLAEEACRAFTNRHGLVTLCLRPVYVDTSERLARHDTLQRHQAERGKAEYWAYVDVRDVCDATLRALTVENVTHDAFLLTADDVFEETPTAELVDRFYPETPWPKIDRATYLAGNPYRSLMDCTHAKEVLGWQPKYSWRNAAPAP